MENYRNLYDCLLESEDLFIVFDNMAGNWKKDRKMFIQSQQELEELSNIKIIDLDEESSEYIN